MISGAACIRCNSSILNRNAALESSRLGCDVCGTSCSGRSVPQKAFVSANKTNIQRKVLFASVSFSGGCSADEPLSMSFLSRSAFISADHNRFSGAGPVRYLILRRLSAISSCGGFPLSHPAEVFRYLILRRLSVISSCGGFPLSYPAEAFRYLILRTLSVISSCQVRPGSKF